MSKGTKHIPLWPSLIDWSLGILLAIMYVSYAVTAESCYLPDLKNGSIRNH